MYLSITDLSLKKQEGYYLYFYCTCDILLLLKNIIDCLKKNIPDRSIIFVFPTQVAADSWAEKTLEVTGCGSVALERFIAWDRFKEASVKSKVAQKKSVSSAVRSLFVHTILAQNAREKFFEALIPPRFAEDFAPFTSWLSRLLPSLALLQRTLTAKGEPLATDDEDRDLLLLDQKYSFFLDENNLFEPAWQVPPFEPNGNNYHIFYPEVIEDFDEYAHLLVNSPHVSILYAADEMAVPAELQRFQNARQELSALVQNILRDHLEDGVNLDRIAISVCGLETIEPYLLRELQLHDIPVQLRSAKPLCTYAAGSLFSLMQDCVSNRFSLSSVKRLLTQSVFPWRFAELNTLLIQFGEEHRCDCAPDTVDVWLDAFRASAKEERLKTYYENLRSSLEAAGRAKSFTELRTAYFTFRTRFFDTELFTSKPKLFTAQTDAVMARCVEELGSLIQVEQEFPILATVLAEGGASSPFTFFTQLLAQKQYLPREQGRGVHLFSYKAAACAPFERHYLINASQNDASVVLSPLAFLSRDKRRNLGVSEKNISQYFFLLYQAGSTKTIFSSAEKTFTGYASPHGWFLTKGVLLRQTAQKKQDTAYEAEWNWWANPQHTIFPQQIFCVQQRGFFARTVNIDTTLDTTKQNGVQGAALRAIHTKIEAKKSREGTFKITASDMNAFSECRIRWLYERVYSIYDPKTAQEMVSALKLGSFYHAVIADVLRHYKENGKVLTPNDTTLHTLIVQEAKKAAESTKLFAAYLPRLVMQTSLQSAIQTLEDFFAFLTRSFASSSIAEIEKKYTVPFVNGAEVTGNIDCLLYLNDDWCILDFKKNTLPHLAKYRDVPLNPLADFQIPLYKHLFETSCAKPDAVTMAAFVSIENAAKRLACVLGKNPSSSRARSLYANSEEFAPVMSAFKEAAKEYYEAVTKENPQLTEQVAAFDVCAKCSYNTLCRTTYFISGEPHAI